MIYKDDMHLKYYAREIDTGARQILLTLIEKTFTSQLQNGIDADDISEMRSVIGLDKFPDCFTDKQVRSAYEAAKLAGILIEYSIDSDLHYATAEHDRKRLELEMRVITSSAHK